LICVVAVAPSTTTKNVVLAPGAGGTEWTSASLSPGGSGRVVVISASSAPLSFCPA
jgi:hypothetical protein